MKRAFTIFCAAWTRSLKSALAHPQDLLFALIALPIHAFASFFTIFAIAGNTLLAGWDFPALLALGGTHMFLGGAVNALVEPNLSYFSDRVLAGRLDDVLLMPAHALFTATLLHQAPTQLLPALAGLFAALAGGAMARAGALGWLLYALALPVALLLAWALRTVLACLCFFFRGSDLTVVYSAIWQFQRYPAGIYPASLRALMYALPFALIAAPPALCLTRANAAQLLLALAAALFMTALALLLWRLGVRRYASATS